MSAATPFNWIDSPGWLLLSGAPDALSEIRARALSRYDAGGDIAYMSLAGDMGDALMDDMAELGAPAGYLVDLDEADNNEIYERLAAAGMIVIESAQNPEPLRKLTTQTVRSAMQSALKRGALIMLEGTAATIAGEHHLGDQGELTAGLDFVHNALISTSAADGELLRRVQVELPTISIVGLARGGALALGPARQIETWGDGDVTISLPDPARPQIHNL